MPRAYNPDVVRRELMRILIKAHRAITLRNDYSASERIWLGRTVEALTAIVEEANRAVRPRLHRVRKGKRAVWRLEAEERP